MRIIRYLDYLGPGTYIGAIAGFVIAFLKFQTSNMGNAFLETIGFIIIVGIVGLFAGWLVGFLHEGLGGGKSQTEKRSYGEAVFSGFVLGGLIGVLDWASDLFFNTPILGEFGAPEGLDILVLGGIGAAASIIWACIHNARRKSRIEREEARRREMQHLSEIQSTLQSALTSALDLANANQILDCIKANKKKQSDMEFIKKTVRAHEDKIHRDVVGAFKARNYNLAVLGLEILSQLSENGAQYKMALDLMHDGNKLLAMMDANGLCKETIVYQEFARGVAAKRNE